MYNEKSRFFTQNRNLWCKNQFSYYIHVNIRCQDRVKNQGGSYEVTYEAVHTATAAVQLPQIWTHSLFTARDLYRYTSFVIATFDFEV